MTTTHTIAPSNFRSRALSDGSVRLGICLALFCTVGTAEAHRCFVRSSQGSLEAVRVAPPGMRPFRLTLADVQMLLVPRGMSASVHVVGPLAFRASATGVEYSFTRPIETAAGMVRLGPGARLSRAIPVGTRARGVAKLIGTVQIHEVAVSCEALTLDEVPDLPPELAPADADVPTLGPMGRALVLRERPNGGATLRVTADDRDELALIETGSSGSWRRVRFDDGDSSVEGWTPKSALRASLDGLFGIGMDGSFGDCGGSSDGFNDDLFDGFARVEFGATVFGAPGRAPWASVRTDELLHVVHMRGAKWAALTEVPGIAEECNSLNHAYVAAASIDFPANAGQRF